MKNGEEKGREAGERRQRRRGRGEEAECIVDTVHIDNHRDRVMEVMDTNIRGTEVNTRGTRMRCVQEWWG